MPMTHIPEIGTENWCQRTNTGFWQHLTCSLVSNFSLEVLVAPDHTVLPAQHFRSLGLLCRWSDSLELATGQSPRPGAHQQQLQTIAENEPISSPPLSTHSAVEMLHDSVLYKSIIDIDIGNE